MKSKIHHTILWYLVISFAAALTLKFGPWARGNGDNPFDKFILYIPGLALLVLYHFFLRKPFFKSKELGFSLGGWKYWILAPLLITAMCLLSYGISILLNPDLLKSKGDIIYTLRESGFFFGHISPGLIAVALINALLGALVSIPLYLGQELGWRTFMLPRLLLILKPLYAFILGGVLWGIWSFVFLKPLFSSSSNLLIASILTILFCIPLGILFQFLFFKTRSIFVAVLAHGALFKSFDTASLFLSPEEMNAQAFGPLGVPGMVLFWALALILFNTINWQTKNTYHE